jgi:hypothetical protein
VGIRLIVEVLTSAPMVLTHREKLLLVALAEDANDDTRITWNSIEDPKFLRYAKLSRSQMYAVIKNLIAKGVLTKLAAGQKNGVAKYSIRPLTPSQCPGIADTETPPQGPENADTDKPQCPETPDTESNGQCQENRDAEPSQCQEFWDVSVPESGTPTPLNPSSTTPSSKQAGAEAPADLSFGIPDEARPLVDGLTAAGVIVRWPFKGNDWFPVLALIKKSGVPAMVDHSVKAAARTSIESARYFLPGWTELAPLPGPDAKRPPLKSVKGTGHKPFEPPKDPAVYANGF